MKYYISDLHLFYENAIKFSHSPFESIQQMHDAILNNWNDRVMNGDYVYILFDVRLHGKNENLIALVTQLKDRKVFVRKSMSGVMQYEV